MISHNSHKTYTSYKTHKSYGVLLYFLILSFFNVSLLRAQEINVTVTPTQPILPPQIMLYITEPANYFNISLSNTGKDNANVYLVMQVEQVNPSSGLSLSTPPKRQPKLPIVVPAGGTRILAPAEVRGLFNHIPLNEIKAPTDLFDSYTNGSFGLLPEGQYELHFTAYRWDPTLTDPVVASAPTSGVAFFSVCYKAQAPEFLTPMAANGQSLLNAAELDPLSPQFTWKAPVVACNPTTLQYSYSMRIVEVLPGQFPDNSMDYNPVVYQASNLSTPMCMIPTPVIKQMKEGTTYAAQVTASPASSNNKMLNYVSIENSGKSTYKLFRLKPSSKQKDEKDEEISVDKEKSTNQDKDDLKKNDDENDEIHMAFGDMKAKGEISDSLYTLTNPQLREPYFRTDGGARKIFETSDIPVVWTKPQYAGGEGMRSDTIKIEYDVELFDNGQRAIRDDALKTKPIYTFHTTELKDTIKWKDIKENVELGDYLVIRVTPTVKKGESVSFTGTDNIIDFALCKRLSQQYFQCQAQVEIEDMSPTTKGADEFKGKTVSIGEYKLTIDDIKGSGSDGFTGTGRVEWQPFGSSIMVCVKFEKMKINKDDVVYEGIAETVANPDMLNSMQVVDKLFSDWGIDNLIGDTGIPYASQLQDKANSKVKSLAENVNLGEYYQKIQVGKGLAKLLTTGKMDKLYMPVKFPTEVMPNGFDAVDLQIVDMKFAPTYATMNIMGQSIMPECDVVKSKILLFGAPRVCISPKSFLPQDGQISLLGDFTLTPSDDIEITFKAPKNVLEPQDGCFISWKEGKLELLGIDADMKVAGIVKDVDGKATTERPNLTLTASVGSWDDFLVKNISIEPFQVEDLPGWTFEASNIVYDHSDYRNSENMKVFPERYNKKDAGCEAADEMWHGLYIGKVSVGFPKSLQLNSTGEKGDKRLWVDAEEMYWDKSGVTVKMGVDNAFEAKEGTLGGWGISLDKAYVQFIQSDFDNCGFSGQINIPILKPADKEKNKGRFGNVDYSCQIRRLTDPRPDKQGKKERTRYSYVFLTEQVDNLDFGFLVGTATLKKEQTYFLVEGYDDENVEGKVNTNIELCLGGTIGIGLVNKANKRIEELCDDLPLSLKIPDIHFTKMRLSNVSRSVEWKSNDERVQAKRQAREDAEKQEKDKALLVLMKSNELNIGTQKEPFYFDLGEWSLASDTKHIGPFSFNLTDFTPGFSKDSLTLELGGSLGLLEDKINVGAKVKISAKVKMPKMDDMSTWSIEDGKVRFQKLNLDLDFTALHLEGELEASDSPDKGYAGKLNIAITGFFEVKCSGGYFEHQAQSNVKGDTNFAWGYFTASIESGAGIHIDPVVINRISGGFYFNCRPTPDKGKFDGKPVAKNGCIGIAFGLGLSTTAGEQALSADLDMLVVYDNTNDCFSTFMLNGKLEAMGGIVKADCSLIYENEKNYAGKTMNNYLCLNITVEAGLNSKAMAEKIKGMNDALAALKNEMDTFQAELDPSTLFKKPKDDAKAGLGEFAGGSGKVKESENQSDLGVKAGELVVSLEFKVTWAENGKTFNKPKWHLYIGQPAKDKRCRFTFLKFDSSICSVDIGADGYLCLGNELPDNGALPEIPSKIRNFLSGNQRSDASMGADLQKAERSRKAAVSALLDGADTKGGVMLGASVWGNITVDLGLLHGSLDAIAGFDVALINYGNNAYCVNSGSEMGKNGWYGMGQIYAYLAAELGLRIHIPKLINKDVNLLNAGIGGMLEMGMPNPTWVEGAVRVKVNLLGGLFKVNKKFDFSAGEHCVPFKGNALDGFEMFSGVSHGSDSIYQALINPAYAVSLAEAKNMTFSTNASIGSHYRLVDPSYSSYMAGQIGETEDRLELNASRTYVFDIDQNLNQNKMKMGVRLFDLGDKPTKLDLKYQENHPNQHLSPSKLQEEYGYAYAQHWDEFENHVIDVFLNKPRSKTVVEKSVIMYGPLKGSQIRDGNSVYDQVDLNDMTKASRKATEVNVSFREDKGTLFHLTNMDLKPGHAYMLVMAADAYEIYNGGRIWCDYYYEREKQHVQIHWKQQKYWFFRIKGEEETKIVPDSIRDIEAYVALAYPSTNGTRVKDTRGEGLITAYIGDIMHPTIALREDISQYYDAKKMKWVLEAYTAKGDTLKPQTRDAVFVKKANSINLEPTSAFNRYSEFTSAIAAAGNNPTNYNFEDERYRLKLTYTYDHKVKEIDWAKTNALPGTVKKGQEVMKDVSKGDSTFTLVDLMLCPAPYNIRISGMSKLQDDNWMQTTSKDKTGGKLLPYVEPFVGATVWDTPTIDYEEDYKKLDDEALVLRNSKYKGKSYRVIDPYLYFAYLGKWVFIGDRKIVNYSFDDAYIPFASESLLFNYNGTVVNCEFMAGEYYTNTPSKSLTELREQMYGLWNDWRYNNKYMPQYPLPTLTTTVGGLTANNQDGKCSSVTPMNLNYSKDMSFSFQDIVEDYTAPYILAQRLSSKLYRYASELRNKFYWHLYMSTQQDNYAFDKLFDADVLKWSKLHRGEYIDLTYRGFNVKVPFYQLPLIFGACFGKDLYGNDSKYATLGLGDKYRSFNYSLNQYAELDKWRGLTETSNLLFRRLTGTNGNWYGYNDQVFCKLISDKFMGSYSEPDMPGYSYLSSYAKTMAVKQDAFDTEAGLKAVSNFPVRVYRVDSYDIPSGQYTVCGYGAGPWEEEKDINSKNKVAGNLYEMTKELTKKAEYEKTHYDQPFPQVLITVSKGKDYGDMDYTLTFLYSDSLYQTVDEDKGVECTYNGMEYVQVYAGKDILDERPWSAYRSKITKVVFDKSFAKADVRSTKKWFELFKKLTSIEGISNLNTKNITDMHGMFWRCESLTSLDLTSWNTSNVTDMGCMFYVCSKLKTLSQKFNTAKVTTMSEMFRSCEALQSAEFDNFTSESLTNTYSMFYNCSALQKISLKGMEGGELTNCAGMFMDCKSLKNLYINNFCPGEKVKSKCAAMFDNVPTSLYSYISYELIDVIKKQIPGRYSQTYNDNYKVLYGYDTNNKYVLLFINDATNFVKNKQYEVEIRNTEVAKKAKLKITVKDFWSGESVMSTKAAASSVPWNTYAANITRVYICERFKQSPTSTAWWFADCRNLEAIYGLPNLNVEKAKNLSYMFRYCGRLKTIDTSKMKTKAATAMVAMFSGCSSIEKLDLSSVYTMDVTDMHDMFNNCTSLTEIKCPLYLPNDYEASGGFVTDNVKNMSWMFANCHNLKKVYDSYSYQETFNTENATEMSHMFYNCRSCDDLPVYITSYKNVEDLTDMVAGCSSLERFSKYESFSKATKLSGMFSGCTSLKEINLSYIKPTALSTATAMFKNVPSNCTIYLPYDTDKKILDESKGFSNRILIVPAYAMMYQVGDHYEMRFFGTNTKLKVGDTWSGYKIQKLWEGSSVMDAQDNPVWAIDVYGVTKIVIESSFKNVPLVNTHGYFFYMKELTSISGLENMNMSKVKDMSYMFSYCPKLTSVSGIENWNTSSATTMKQMFANSSALTSLNLSKWNTSNVTDMSSMFMSCSGLQTLNLTGSFNTANVEDMSLMFSGCKSLTSLNLSNVNTAKADATPDKSGKYYNLGGMFMACSSLKKLDLSKFTVKHQSSLTWFFSNCSSLEELDLINWDTENLKQLEGTFKGCSSLRKLVLGSKFNAKNLKKSMYDNEFEGVHDLVVITPTDKLSEIKTSFTNLGFKVGTTGNFYDKMPEREPQVIWTEANKTLTFFYGIPVGSTYNGMKVTKVWNGDDVTNTPYSNSKAPWNSTVSDKLTTVVFDPSFATNVKPTKTNGWFYGCKNLTEIKGLENLNTSSVTSMANMFGDCTKLTSLNVSKFNTANVTNMYGMFQNMSKLEAIDVSKFNTAKVTNIGSMFYSCRELTTLDLTNWDLRAVTNATYFCYYSTKLKTMKAGATCSLSKMSSKANYCFNGISGLEVQASAANLSTVRTAFIDKLGFVEGTNGYILDPNKKVAQVMWFESQKRLFFYYGREYKAGDTYKGWKITKLWKGSDVTATSIDSKNQAPWADAAGSTCTVAEFDESFKDVKPTRGCSWFYNFKAMYSITGLKYLNTSSMTTMSRMFDNCFALTSLDLSTFSTANVTSMYYMFYSCSKLKSLDLTNFNTGKVVNMCGMFRGCEAMTTLKISTWNTVNVTDFSEMFYDCKVLSTLDVSNLNTIAAKYMNHMFYNCAKLPTLDVGSFKTQNVTTMKSMFAGCSSIKGLGVFNWNTQNVTDMSYMFSRCTNLECLNAKNWNTAKVTTLYAMFQDCTSLTWVMSDNWKTGSVTTMSCMFKNDAKLDDIRISDFDVSKVTTMSSMFEGCSALTRFYVKKWNTKTLMFVGSMFKNCTKLKYLEFGKYFIVGGSNQANLTAFSGVKGTQVDYYVASGEKADDVKANIRASLKRMGWTKTNGEGRWWTILQ